MNPTDIKEEKDTKATGDDLGYNPDDLIEIDEEGVFVCVECENEGPIETANEEGMGEADLEKIAGELAEKPKKVISGACPVCGMEYQFKLYEETLYLLPSDEEK